MGNKSHFFAFPGRLETEASDVVIIGTLFVFGYMDTILLIWVKLSPMLLLNLLYVRTWFMKFLIVLYMCLC